MAELDRQILRTWLRTSAITGWALLTAAFLLVTLYYIVCHHVEPLSRDQWHMYDALITHGLLDTSLGTVSGHRHILAFLLYTIDMHWFNGMNRFLIAVDWLLNGALILLLCFQAWQLPLSRLARLLLCGWIVVTLTWLLNIALIGWGFNGINNYLSIVPTVFAIFFLHRAVHLGRPALALIACLLGILATLSFANGILVWLTAVISLYLWRAPKPFYWWTLAASACAIGAYILLPGAEAAGQTLKWPGAAFVMFPLQVMGGPVYHLLRSWHIAEGQWLTNVAFVAGTAITGAASGCFWQLARQRPAMNTFQSLCVALMCLGAGSCLMLSMSRLDEYLDFSVDRFQIFALLVWIGTVGLCINAATAVEIRRWEILFVVFPLLAFPSQLDWGARLAEYRNRVDISLLSYQVYLPLEDDAEKALHWNWENKLPSFFAVLEHLRQQHKNIFHDNPAENLGLPFAVDVQLLPACRISTEHTRHIFSHELLDPGHYPGLSSLPQLQPYRLPVADSCHMIGHGWAFTVREPAWDSGLLLDTQHIVRGLVRPIHNSVLPRASGQIKTDFNAVGIARMDEDSQAVHTVILLRDNAPICQGSL